MAVDRLYADSALSNGAQANREEADARSVFVGNVITSLSVHICV